MIEEEQKGDFIVLSKENDEGIMLGKALRYKGRGKFSIEPFSVTEIVNGK